MNLATTLLLAYGTGFLAAGSLDGQTNVPLGAVLGSAATVFLVGMWVSRKVTKFEEQQAANMRRLDIIEAHLFNKGRH